MLTQFLTLPNLDFITAHSSLITAQMGSVTPYFRLCLQVTLHNRWHGHLSAKVTKNANLGYSHDWDLSWFQGNWGFL